jgi:hypothetical protein
VEAFLPPARPLRPWRDLSCAECDARYNAPASISTRRNAEPTKGDRHANVDAIGIKHHPVALSPDLFAVCLVSFLGLAIGATVFQLLAAYDLSWILTH